MITTAQATEYMEAALGIELPAFLVSAACDKVEAAEPSMIAAGYSESDQVLIQCMAVTLVAAAGAPRRTQSQGAPSGASRSFKHADNALTALRRSLRALDTANTVADLTGPDPSTGTLLVMTC